MSLPTCFRVVDLSRSNPLLFHLRPEPDAMSRLADSLGLTVLRKLSFKGKLAAQNRRDWHLTARLGATVVQPCVVSHAPVTTRIDTDVTRVFVADLKEPLENESKMRIDDNVEPLPEWIDLSEILRESLILMLPDYPRKQDAHLHQSAFTEPGTAPMRDEDAHPFAQLASLRKQLGKAHSGG